MIYDSFNNFKLYLPIHPHFADIAEFLETTDSDNIAIGKYEIAAKGSFAIVSEYSSKPQRECFIECHRQFIDIQIVAKGIECIGIGDLDSCKRISAYDIEKDFQKLRGEVSLITMKPGLFAVFFPHDAHMPQVNYHNSSCRVKKIVIKIPAICNK